MKFLFFILLLSFFSFAETPSITKDLKELLSKDDTKVVKEKEVMLNYRALISEIKKIRLSKNGIRVSEQIRELGDQVLGRTFVFEDRVIIKRDPLLSRELAFWFDPGIDREVRMNIDVENIKSFKRINKYDFIICKAKLIKFNEYDKEIIFDFIELKQIEPFNPYGPFIDFNKELERIYAIKEKSSYFNYKSYLKNYSSNYSGKLGYIKGKVLKLELTDDRVGIAHFKLNSFDVVVSCEYNLETFAHIEVGSEISLAVLLDKIEHQKVSFFRGVLLQNQ